MSLWLGAFEIDTIGVRGMDGRVWWFGFGFKKWLWPDDDSLAGWTLYAGLFALGRVAGGE